MLKIIKFINAMRRGAKCFINTNGLSQETSHVSFIVTTQNGIQYLQEGYLKSTAINIKEIFEHIGSESNELMYTIIVVNTRSLDSFNFKPNLIKIDVQGAELSVLRGAINTIKLNKPELFIEKPDNSDNERDLISFIKHVLNYQIIRFETNWLCIPISTQVM